MKVEADMSIVAVVHDPSEPNAGVRMIVALLMKENGWLS